MGQLADHVMETAFRECDEGLFFLSGMRGQEGIDQAKCINHGLQHCNMNMGGCSDDETRVKFIALLSRASAAFTRLDDECDETIDTTSLDAYRTVVAARIERLVPVKADAEDPDAAPVIANEMADMQKMWLSLVSPGLAPQRFHGIVTDLDDLASNSARYPVHASLLQCQAVAKLFRYIAISIQQHEDIPSPRKGFLNTHAYISNFSRRAESFEVFVKDQKRLELTHAS